MATNFKCSMTKKKESLSEVRKSNKAKALAELANYFGTSPDGNTIYTSTISSEDEIEIGNICDKYGVDFALGTSHVTVFGKGESKKNEDRSLGEVEYYEILKVTKNDAPVTNVTSTRYRSADELYKALDGICGASTRGNLVVAKESPDSAIEGYIDLAYADYDDTWVFRVWFTLKFTDPVATALKDLGLDA